MQQTEYIYEILDATDPDVHFGIGLYQTLDDALQAATTPDVLNCENLKDNKEYDYFKLTINKRPIGVYKPSFVEETVATIVWEGGTEDEKSQEWFITIKKSFTKQMIKSKIEKMSANKETSSQDSKPHKLFLVEPHGSGWAIYRGRDSEHHGLLIALLTECEPGVPEMIEDALNERVQRMINDVTK